MSNTVTKASYTHTTKITHYCMNNPYAKSCLKQRIAHEMLERRREIHRKPLRADSNVHGNKFIVY